MATELLLADADPVRLEQPMRESIETEARDLKRIAAKRKRAA